MAGQSGKKQAGLVDDLATGLHPGLDFRDLDYHGSSVGRNLIEF